MMWNQFSNAFLSAFRSNPVFYHLYKYPMRPPSLATFVRTLNTVSNATARVFPQQQSSGLVPFTSAQLTFNRSNWMPLPSFSSLFTTKAASRNMSYPFQPGNEYWDARLSDVQKNVVLDKGTEPPFSGKFDQHFAPKGSKETYNCAGCAQPLYTAQHKFKSGCGWPAFFDAIPGAVTRHTDSTLGMARTEIVCSNCGGHLGHVFKGEGYATPTDERHCVNSVSIDFGGERGSGEGKVAQVEPPHPSN